MTMRLKWTSLLRRQLQFRQRDLVRLGRPPAQGVPDGLRLVVDLLEHEVREPALLRRRDVPGHLEHVPVQGPPVQCRQRDPVRRDAREVAVFQDEHAARLPHDGGDVRGQEVLALAQPDDERRSGLGGVDDIRLLAGHDADGIRARHLGQGRPDGRLQRPRRLPVRLDQVRQHFRVRVAREDVPCLGQLLFQPDIILDDAVVDQRQPPGAVRVRVGVDIVGPPVRRPARVRDDRPR